MQYARFMRGALHGDFCQSLRYRRAAFGLVRGAQPRERWDSRGPLQAAAGRRRGFDVSYAPTDGKPAELKGYNALSVPADYFLEAMEHLRTRHLNVALDAVLHPVSSVARQATAEQQAAATAPPVQKEELSAGQWFERACGAIDPDEKIRC